MTKQMEVSTEQWKYKKENKQKFLNLKIKHLKWKFHWDVFNSDRCYQKNGQQTWRQFNRDDPNWITERGKYFKE